MAATVPLIRLATSRHAKPIKSGTEKSFASDSLSPTVTLREEKHKEKIEKGRRKERGDREGRRKERGC